MSVRNLNSSKFFNIGIISYQAGLIYIYSICDQNTEIRILGKLSIEKKGVTLSSKMAMLIQECEEISCPDLSKF